VVVIGGSNVTATTGSIVINGSKEYIYDGSKWQLFGDLSALSNQLGKLAYYDSATGSYTPAGTILTGTGTLTSKSKYTPAGTITLTSATTTVKFSTTSTAPTGAATATYGNYKPGGTVTVTASRSTSSATVLTNVTGNSLVSGLTTAAPATATPTNGVNYTKVNDHNLNLLYLVQSKENAISSTTTTSALTGVTVSATGSFSGNTVYVPPLATLTIPTSASFGGTQATLTVTGTVINSISFSGTAATITVQRT
jgi:hypothetical protein